MKKRGDDTFEALNGLIQTCKDGAAGYRTAVDGTDNPELKELFTEYSEQCRLFGEDLGKELAALGREPDRRSRSLAARAFHGWMNIKSAVTGRDDRAILAECERGEDMRKRNYQDALRRNLPAPVQRRILSQYEEVKAAHDRIRDLERLRKGN